MSKALIFHFDFVWFWGCLWLW